jgi:hypothetical protein
MSKIGNKEVGKVIKNFPLTPRFGKVVITLNNMDEDGSVVLSNNVLSDVQYIIAKGSMVNEVEVGDKVLIDIERMMVPVKQDNGNSVDTVMQIKVDPIEVDGVVYAFIEDRLIKAIDNRK